MGRRRRKKNNDLDLAKAVVGLVFFLAFAYTRDLKTAGYISLSVIAGAVALGFWVVYFRRKPSRKSVSSASISSSSRSKVRPSSARPDIVDAEMSRRLENLPAEQRHVKPNDWSLNLIKSLDWKVFEELCAGYFKAKGRRAEVTALGADGGVDIHLYLQDKLLGVVQCKAWSRKPVGVREIREILGIMTDAGCPLGVYVTTSGYTQEAQSFAKGKHIKLLDAEKLLKMIQALPDEPKLALLQQATAGDYTTPSCPSCGIKLVTRTSKKGKNAGQSFWGCTNFPTCRYTMHRARSA